MLFLPFTFKNNDQISRRKILLHWHEKTQQDSYTHATHTFVGSSYTGKKKTSINLNACSPSRIAILLQLLSHTWMTTRRCIFCIKRTLRRINRHTTGVNDALWIFEPRRRIEKSCQGEAGLETCNTPVSEQRVMMCLVSMAVHHILVHPQLMCSYYSASRAPWQTNKKQ